jgi:hypothetical protein
MFAASATSPARGATALSPLVTTVIFVLSYFVARAGIEMLPAGSALRLAAALLPVIPFGFMLAAYVGRARRLDELQRRIQLEALAFAFLTFMLVMMTLGLLQMVVTLKLEDLSYRHVWAMMPVLYFAGLALAQRRYR